MSDRRVVITGLGLLSPLGSSIEEVWNSILDGKSGVSNITTFDTSNNETKFAATVKNFNPENYLDRKEVRRLDPFIQYGLVSAYKCIKDSGIEDCAYDPTRIGVSVGSGIGGLQTIEKNSLLLSNSGPKKISPFFVPGSIVNMVSGYISLKSGYKGPNISIASACSSASHSIGYSYRSIVHGDCEIMLTGGAEMATTPLGLSGFNAAKALSTRNDDPKSASRPWDKDRDGFVLGEGSACLMLEELEHAKQRGAKIYGEIIGFGMSADAHHITAPPEDGSGAALSMKNALKDSKISPEDVSYINAHGTSTPAGDLAETKAIKEAFGNHVNKLVISSTKSMTGHLLGAAGAIEAIFSLLAIRDNIAPPTINLDSPDKECDLNYSANTTTKINVQKSISNSFGFGGTNATLVFSELE